MSILTVMFHWLGVMYRVKGLVAVLLACTNVLVMAVPFFTAVSLKLLLPGRYLRRYLTRVVTFLAAQYNRNNGMIFRMMGSIRWHVSGLEGLNRNTSYLVIANHQSWADIPVLQCLLEPHIPLLKFFLKKQLIWVPILGAAWWALDFPFMRRYSREYLQKHPEKRGEDLLETRRMCARFADTPVSVMSFLEGTRYSEQKHAKQSSPYRYLLRPKVGGVALVIASIGDSVRTLLDVTIDYGTKQEVTIWELFSGQVPEINVHIESVNIPEYFPHGDYENDPEFRAEIKRWIESLWQRKDQRLSEAREQASTANRGSRLAKGLE